VGTAARRKSPKLEPLEDRTLPSVTIAATNNNGNGYTGLDFNQSGGYVPPDTNGAAGPSNYVETVNQTLAIYSPKATGAAETSDSFSHFWFTTGGLPHADSGSGLSDPVVTYNDQIGRFVVGDQDVNFNTHVSNFDIAVSKSSSPATLTTADWNFYHITTTESGFDADYPGNLGYNHDGLVVVLNMFGVVSGGHVQVLSVSNSDLAAGVSQANLHVFHNDLADFDDRPTTMHDSVAGDPMWLVTEHGDNKSIDVIKMTSASGTILSNSATFTYTNLAVTPYSTYVNPLNPNGTVITNNIDGRIQKAAEWNHTLVASHSVGISSTQSVAQWYKIDVSSGTPVLSDEGRINAGNNTYVYYPAIDINSSGQIGMTYMKSGTDTSTDFESMYVTGRTPSDAAGTMEASVLVPAGTGQTNYKDFTSGGRAGDLSGINVDPSDGSFWAANEFANTEAVADWGTAIANFTLAPPVTADLAVTNSGPSAVTAGTNATYIITLTNNGPNAAQNVVLSDTLPTGAVFASMTAAAGNPDSFTLSQSGGTVTETATAAMTSGHSDTFTLVVSAPSSLANGAAFNDTASVSSSTTDPTTGDNTATITGSVATSADLAVANSGPSSVTAGTNATYTITLTNNGPSNAQAVVLSDTLPTGAVFVSMTAAAGNPDSFTLSQSGGSVTETATAAVASGHSDTFTLVVSAPSSLANGAAFADSASANSSTADPNTSNNSASVTGSITTSADLAVTNSGPTSVTAGTNATYTITLTNNGPSNAQGVVLSDTLPTGAVFASMTAAAGNPDSFTFAQSSGSVTETATAAVASGHSDTFTLVVSAPSNLSNGAAFNDSASASSSTADPNTSNNSATVNGSITTSADLAVTNSGPSSVLAGSNATYTITLTNHGPSDAQGVVLSDTLPTGAVFVSMTAAAGNPDSFTLSQSGGSVTETATAAVASGHSDTFTLVVSAPSSLANGAAFNDTASVSSTTADPSTTDNTATVTGSINNNPPADMAVTASGPAAVTAGTNATYTITLTNNGPNAAQNVVLSDTLPAGAVFVSSTPAAGNPDNLTLSQSGSTLTETAAAAVASGNVDTFTLVVSAPSNLSNGAAFNDTASVSSTSADPNTTNDTAIVSGSVATSADLAVTNSGPSAVTAGTNATYTITLTNNGPSNAQAVVLSDTLPTGSVFVSMTAAAGNPDSFTLSQSGGTVTETANAAVASGHSDTFTLVVTAPSSLANGATFSDSASVSSSTSDPNTSNNSASVTGSITTSADLAVTNSGPTSVTAGTNATYTITLTTNGPSNAQGVVLSDTLPTGAVFASMTAAAGNPDSFTFAQSSGSVTETATAAVASGHSDTFTLVVSAPSSLSNGAAFNDSASASSSTADPNTSNNSATVTGSIATSADLAVTNSGPSSVLAGSNATYTITLTNNGPSDAQGVVLSDTLPTGGVFVSMTAATGNPDSFTLSQSGGSITETATAAVASGHSDTFTLVVSAPSSLANGAAFNDTASVSSTTADPSTTDNTATVTGAINNNPQADLAVTATGPSSVTAGTNATYTITLTNTGPANAQAVVLSDTLPTGAVFVSMTAATGNPDSFTLSQSGGSVTETATAAVASGHSDTFTLVVSTPSSLASGAAFNDSASVSSSTSDPNTGNNSATVSGSITTSADLAVTNSAVATSTEGNNITYTVTVTNNGPSDAQGVTLTDTLGANLNFVSASTGQGTFTQSGGVVTFSIGTVAAGQSVTATVTAQSIEDGNLTATASVTSSTADPNTSNNTVVATTAVAEGQIVVSAPIPAPRRNLTNFTVATFTHANGVEPASAFTATINWGDGKTSLGTITQSGTTYTVKGSHAYLSQSDVGFTITTTVTEVGNAPVNVAPGASPELLRRKILASQDSGIGFWNSMNPADLAVTAGAANTSTEGNDITYTLTVTNNGPSDAADVTLTDTLGANLTYVSATPQGTFTQSGSVVTFSIGMLPAGQSFTAMVTALAIEDGNLTATATVSSSTPDPNTSNNTAVATTTVAEAAINVSAPITTQRHNLSNFTVATFTQANGLEPAGAFTATINWGDGTTSVGTITQSGTTYTVKGSHSYNVQVDGGFVITTTVTEVGNAPNLAAPSNNASPAGSQLSGPATTSGSPSVVTVFASPAGSQWSAPATPAGTNPGPLTPEAIADRLFVDFGAEGFSHQAGANLALLRRKILGSADGGVAL
jgi:uncharacterized repeat protein (TIGR01451 family)